MFVIDKFNMEDDLHKALLLKIVDYYKANHFNTSIKEIEDIFFIYFLKLKKNINFFYLQSKMIFVFFITINYHFSIN